MANSYLGQILQFGGNFAIKGTALCNGQILSISQFTALFSLLGTQYGGNGTSNFALPNLQGRSMVHQGNPTFGSYVIGETAGATTVTLTGSNLPSHNHSITSGATFNASGLQPKATLQMPVNGAVLGHTDDISTNTVKAKPAIYCPSGTTTSIPLGANISTGVVGASQPLSIVNPYLTISCLITLQGVFPARN